MVTFVVAILEIAVQCRGSRSYSVLRFDTTSAGIR